MNSQQSKWANVKTFGLAALVAGVLSVSLAACGNAAATPSDTGNSGQATVASATTAPTVPVAVLATAPPTVQATAPAEASATAPAASAPSQAASAPVDVKLSEWAITPASLTVPAGKVTFVVSNDGKYTHNLTVQSASGEVGKTPNFKKADGSKNLELDLQPGTYTVLCTVPGHAEQGMKGTLTVGK